MPSQPPSLVPRSSQSKAGAIIEPRGDWPQRLVAHLQTLPANLIPDMGFPAD